MLITKISPTAGANGDGVLLGSVDESLLTAVTGLVDAKRIQSRHWGV